MQWPSPPGAVPACDVARGAWAQLLGAILGFGGLAFFLPGPLTVAAAFVGRRDVLPTGSAAAAVGEAAMLLTAAVVLWSLLAWALVVAGIAASSRLPGVTGHRARRILGRVAPIAVRRVLLTVVGASMVTGIAACGTGPAVASAGGHPAQFLVGGPGSTRIDHAGIGNRPGATGQARSWIAVEGSAVHLRPTAVRAAIEGSAVHLRPTAVRAAIDSPDPKPPAPITIDWPATPTRVAESVVVHRGDSLWSIASRHLPAHASPSDVDRAWHQWYAANAALIGGNPNLILPGQILQPPNPGTGDRP